MLNNNIKASDGLKFQFSTDGEGNYGYLGADDSFIPFKKGMNVVKLGSGGTYQNMSFSAKSIPKYQSLTSDNFFVKITGMQFSSGTRPDVYNSSMYYDASTGYITITGCYLGVWDNSTYKWSYVRYDVYCIY